MLILPLPQQRLVQVDALAALIVGYKRAMLQYLVWATVPSPLLSTS